MSLANKCRVIATQTAGLGDDVGCAPPVREETHLAEGQSRINRSQAKRSRVRSVATSSRRKNGRGVTPDQAPLPAAGAMDAQRRPIAEVKSQSAGFPSDGAADGGAWILAGDERAAGMAAGGVRAALK